MITSESMFRRVQALVIAFLIFSKISGSFALPAPFLANIFGFDHRVPAEPTEQNVSPIVHVYSAESGDGECTGSFVWKNIVLTAAHCVDDAVVTSTHKGKVSYTLKSHPTVYTHYMSDSDFDNSASVTRIWWGTLKTKSFRNQDWALLALDANLGDDAGYYGTRANISKRSAFAENLFVAGYGSDKPGLHVHTGCAIRAIRDDGLIEHDCDTTRGDSGAPLVHCDDKNGCWIVGLHVAENRGDSETSLTVKEYSTARTNFAVNPAAFNAKVSELRHEFPDGYVAE